MGIFEDDLSTLEARIATNLAELDFESKRSFRQIVQIYQRLRDRIWLNKLSLNATQVLDSLGTSAVDRLRALEILGNTINQLVPGSVVVGPPDSWTVTENPDGSATATQAQV